MNNSQLSKYSVFILVISSLLACDTSGDGSSLFSDLPADDITTPLDTPLQNVNGVLEGLYFSGTSLNEGEWLNLHTGETGEFFEYDENIPRGLEAVVPAQDGTEYIELHISDPPFGSPSSTLLIKDMRTGLVTDEFTVPGEISSLPRYLKLSPDRQIIAARRDRYDDFNYNLSFFTRTGELIAVFADDSVSEFDWLPDGRFGYFKAGQLHIGELRGQDSIFGRAVASVNHLDGRPLNLKASPDGSAFVFEMYTDAPIVFETNNYRDATVWRVDSSGENLDLVATMADRNGSISDSPRVNNPLWSLDGKYLMMSVGVSSSSVILWEGQYSTVTDDYEPIYITDVITANSEGFMYLLPKDTRGTVFLKDQSYPAIAYNNSGAPHPYSVSALHIEPGARLVEAVAPLEEFITPVTSALSGTVTYLKDKTYQDEFENKLTVMEYDAASGTERVLFQKSGDDFDDSYYFGISRDKRYFAHWLDNSYDDKHLKVYDNAGTELASYQLLYPADPVKGGKDLVSPPHFSPQNPELLLYRFIDESDDDKLKFGVLNWVTGKYVLLYSGDFHSVTWQENGSIVVSTGKDIHRYDLQNGQFNNPVKLFSTPNDAKNINVSIDQTKLAFTMSGHIFWSNMDGSNLTQVTAPPSTGYEYSPTWSPDGTHIMFNKDDDRYIISAATRNARIYLDEQKNSDRTRYITEESRRVGYWIP